jgi:uncharacterized protein YjiS (DUF1127 family)
MPAPHLMNVITVHRPWHRRLVDKARELLATPGACPRATSLRELDAQALADIGIDASEIDSVEAEARGPRMGITRRRIVDVRS